MGIEGKGKVSKRKMPKGDGKIAGQGTRKDTVTTLLFKTKNENFAELFNRTLLADAPVSPEDLDEKDIKETAFLKIVKEGGGTSLVQYRDVIKGVKDGRTLAILGIENQTEIDYHMPFRVLEVDFVNYARQVRIIEEQHNFEWKDEEGHKHKPEDITAGEYMGNFLKTDRISPCLTLVVYWGEKPWDAPRRLSDMFADGPWKSLAWDIEMNILDVCRMSDEEICSYVSELRTVFGFKKYALDKDKLWEFIDNNQKYFSNVSETALNAIDELTHSPELQKIRTSKYQTQEGGFDMCLGIQEMIKEGKQEGIKEGKLEGIKEGKLEQARETTYELFDMGLSSDKIAKAVKVSLETVKKWIAERPVVAR